MFSMRIARFFMVVNYFNGLKCLITVLMGSLWQFPMSSTEFYVNMVCGLLSWVCVWIWHRYTGEWAWSILHEWLDRGS